MPKGGGWAARWASSALVESVEGGYRVNLNDVEREVLRQTFEDLRALVAAEDPATRRLFPTAYVDQPELEADYRRLVGDDLVRSQLAALELVERTLDGSTVDTGELETWMRAVNSVRLVLGTRLDVGEEPFEIAPDDPDLPVHAVYAFLSNLLGVMVAVLANESG